MQMRCIDVSDEEHQSDAGIYRTFMPCKDNTFLEIKVSFLGSHHVFCIQDRGRDVIINADVGGQGCYF